MTDTTEPLPVDFRKNGTTWLLLDGDGVVLRRPKVKEFRDLRDGVHEVNDRISDEQIDDAAAGRELDATVARLEARMLTPSARRARGEFLDENPDEDPDEIERGYLADAERLGELDEAGREELKAARRTQRTFVRDVSRRREEHRLAWVHEAIRLLAPAEAKIPDEPDDLDSYFAEAEFVSALVDHWRGTPLARGGR